MSAFPTRLLVCPQVDNQLHIILSGYYSRRDRAVSAITSRSRYHTSYPSPWVLCLRRAPRNCHPNTADTRPPPFFPVKIAMRSYVCTQTGTGSAIAMPKAGAVHESEISRLLGSPRGRLLCFSCAYGFSKWHRRGPWSERLLKSPRQRLGEAELMQ